MNLRLRGPYGQANLSGLDPDMNVPEFQDMLVAHSGVVVEDQELLVGYPPKAVELPTKKPALVTIEDLGFNDGDIITVRAKEGGAAPSMASRGRSLSATRSLSRNSVRSSKSFNKFASPSMQSLNEEGALSEQMMSTPLDDEDPMFSDGSAFNPKPRPIGRSISQGDVLAADAAFAASLSNPHSVAQNEDGVVQAAAIPTTISSAPRRKKISAARAANGIEHNGVPFGARPEPEKPKEGTFQDWAAAPDPSCTCVNCLIGSSMPAPAQHARLDDHLIVARRVVDDDNSCLFSAVAYIMEGYRSKGPQLRQVIAEAVTQDPSQYNEGMLGKPTAEYAKWILDPSKWGGAIELSILSKYYGREIAAYDIKTLRCDVYGEGSGFRERGMVIYDGLHYDALSIAAFENAPEEIDVSIFDPLGPQGEPANRGAQEIAKQAQREKRYTDTASFTLRCQLCSIGVKGEAEALDHAKATGHAAFAEYNAQEDPGSPGHRLRSMTSFNSRIRVGAGV